MGERFHKAHQDAYPFSGDLTEGFFGRIIAAGAVFITARGFLAGMCAEEPSGAYRIAHELFWWAEDGSGAALLKAFEDWAAEQGCHEVNLSHPYGSRAEVVMKRNGYAPKTLTWSKPCASPGQF